MVSSTGGPGAVTMKDVGQQALDLIHTSLMIDEEWTERTERSFSWLGHRLMQTLRATPPFEDGGTLLSRLSATTVVVDNVTMPESVVLRVLAEINQHAVGSAYTFLAEERQVVASTCSDMHADTLEWRSKQFEGYVIAQLVLAESESDYLAARTGGRVARQGHAARGRRDVADDMLNVLEDVFAQAGRGPSRYENAFEFETIADIAGGSRVAATVGGSATGIALECAFGESTSLAMMETDIPHRRLGSGLSVRLHLPVEVTLEEADQIAGLLNRREAGGEPDALHYGAWYTDEREAYGRTVAYQMFFPNSFYRLGIAQDAAYSCVGRGRWVDRVLHGRLSEHSAWEIMTKRVKKYWGDR